jgi:Ankyrin repeats (3 copies)/Ankyrin repeats (many copies)
LDETYERVLREIKKPNRDHAQRLLQCLVVAVRPLRVEELAEVLAVDFDNAEGVPRLNPGWRWEDQEQALLTSCSSLITIVGIGHFRIVQFSHFSVKEYLTSARLATSTQDLSRYHIYLEPAHTILAQACLAILLQPETLIKPTDVAKPSPLAGYAAEHWVVHAQFENVSLLLRQAMEYLFDPDKPHFAAWLQIYDMDVDPDAESTLFEFTPILKSASTPLYFAALCGFQHPVEQLIVKYPQHINAIGGYYMTPAVAALAGRHFLLAQILHRSGSSVDPQGDFNKTPLHSAAYYGDLEMVQVLLDCKANVNARAERGSTPLGFALSGPYLSDARVVRLLLGHGADPGLPALRGLTPLHHASEKGWIEVVRLLIEHGVSVEVKDDDGRTPLDVASGEQREEVIKLLLEHRSK